MSLLVGSNNARSLGGGGGSSSLSITKSYTIGFADVQALMCGGVNSGIADKCMVSIEGVNGVNDVNSITSSMPTSAQTFSTYNKYDYSGYYSADKGIGFGYNASMGIRLKQFTDNENNVRYGFVAYNGGSPTQETYQMRIRVSHKPMVASGNTYATIRGNIKLLVWNTQTNEYETIEQTNIVSDYSSSANTKIASGYIGITISYKYILCGILEASAEYVAMALGVTLRDATDEDMA